MNMIVFPAATCPKSSKGVTSYSSVAKCVVTVRICSDKYDYQTKSLEPAPEICGCRTTTIYFIYGLLVLI